MNKPLFPYKASFDILNTPQEITPEYLSQSQALEDLEQCLYLLQTSCASYVEQSNNINIEECYQKIISELKQQDKIQTEYFMTNLLGSLTEGIKDLHSKFFWKHTDSNNETKTFFKNFTPKTTAWFSENLFQKNEDYYIDIKNPSIKLHGLELNMTSKIQEKTQLYFVPVIKDLKHLYRAAKFFTSQSPEEKDFEVEGHKLTFYKQNFDLQNSWNHFREIYNKTENTYYWIMPDHSWSVELQDEYYNYFHNYNETIRNKQNLIIDNRWNYGGIPYKQLKLLLELFGHSTSLVDDEINREVSSDEDILEGTCLLSNPIVQFELNSSQNAPEWKYKSRIVNFYKKQLKELTNGKNHWVYENINYPAWYYLCDKITYKGKIILIVDNKTYSFGEQLYYTITKDFGYKNVVLVGTNTAGCVSYGNPITYYLKNSGIGLSLSSRTDGFSDTKFQKEYIETRGLIPDYWATTDSELEDLLNYLIKK